MSDKNGTWTFTDEKIIPDTLFQVFVSY